jgi:competence protein ComGB
VGDLRKKHSCWSYEEQARFLKRLSTLLDRGYPILDGLTILMLHLPSKQKMLLQHEVEEMKGGGSFHQALSRLSFHRDVLGYLYFAERHGDLSFALREGSFLLEQKVSYTNKLKKIIQYPLFLIGISIGLITLINVWLLPEFSSIFESMTLGENIILSSMLFLSRWIPRLLFISVFLFSLLMIMIFDIYSRTPIVKRMEWMSMLPIYGSITVKFYSFYFAMQLSQLLRGGLSVYEAISVFEQQEHFYLFKVEAEQMKKELRSGESLPAIILAKCYFEDELSSAISFGSANGELARELYFYSKLTMEVLEEMLNKRLAVIQPTVFLVIGVMIMGLYIAIMQPMFQMLNGL